MTVAPLRPSRPPGEGKEIHETQAAVYAVIVAAIFLPVLFLLGRLLGLGGAATIALLVIGEVAIWYSVSQVVAALAGQAGRAAQTLYAPSGSTTPYQRTFSYQDAMVMRGDVAGALASYEALIVELPADVPVRLAAAAIYAAKGRDPARAAALYREARLLPAATRGTEFAATNALIDLYRGALADEPRLLAELRRLVERFPGTPPAEYAGKMLAAMKAPPSAGTT